LEKKLERCDELVGKFWSVSDELLIVLTLLVVKPDNKCYFSKHCNK